MNDPVQTIENAANEVQFKAEKEAALHKLEGVRDHASKIADEVKGAARDLGSAAHLGANAFRDAAYAKASETRTVARERALTTRSVFEARVREEPLKFTAISFAVGFAVGVIFRR